MQPSGDALLYGLPALPTALVTIGLIAAFSIEGRA